MTDRLAGLRSDEAYRACVAVLDEAGIPHEVDTGGRHPKIVFEFRGLKMSKILSHSGTASNRAVKKSAGDIRRMLREAERQRPKIAPEQASVLQAEPAPSQDQQRTRTMDATTAAAGESNRPIVTVSDGRVIATSRDVAACFDKEHRNVLRDIDRLIADAPELVGHRLLTFEQTVETRENPSGGAPIPSRAFTMTRDGFALLAMGFTGAKALRWKLKYIEAFNAMEAELLRLSRPSIEGPVDLSDDAIEMVGGVQKAVVRKAIADEISPALADLKAADDLILERIAALEAGKHATGTASADDMVTAFEIVASMAGVPESRRYAGLPGQVSSLVARFCMRHGYQARTIDLRPGEKLVFPRRAALDWLSDGGRREIFARINAHAAKTAGQGSLKLVPTTG